MPESSDSPGEVTGTEGAGRPLHLSEPSATQWLHDALADVPVGRDVVVEGVPVRYNSWGIHGDPGVVLVHGGMAHAHWWDHLAPLLTGRHVVALDLTGHGDSGRRDGYDMQQWSREIVAVIRDGGLDRPVVVGHSMGGFPSVSAGVSYPHEISGIITIDSRFNDHHSYSQAGRPSLGFSSLDEAVRAFTPRHALPGLVIPPLLLRHIAEASLQRDGDVWRWKRDDRYEVVGEPLRELLPRLSLPLAIVQSEFGVVTDALAAEMRALTRSPSMKVAIPAAGHNPMLEQPVALASVLRTLLATWWPATR